MPSDKSSPLTKGELEEREAGLIQNKLLVTARLSETTRFLGFGLMAVYFALRTGTSPYAIRLVGEYPCTLTLVGFCGALSILLDYIQYWAFAESIEHARKREARDYDKDRFSYKLSTVAFYVKQGTAIVGSILLLWVFANSRFLDATTP